MRKLIPLLLLLGTASAQTSEVPDQLLIIPTAGAPERIETLARAGLIYGSGDQFAVAPAAGGALEAVRGKGWVHQLVTDRPGTHLYMVTCASASQASRFGRLATLLYHSGTEALLAADRAEELALYATQGPGLTQLIRMERELIRMAPERAIPASSGALDMLTPHPDIQAMLTQVNQQNLLNTVTWMSALHNRRSDQPGGVQAQNQLLADFQAIPGLSVSLHDFDGGADNVVAVLPGSVDPTKIVVLGGHYDSIAGGATAPAPGADDNASGTASVLECARILSQHPFKYTIHFLCFASEEFGLYGSAAYASMLASQNADVVAMVNTDMNAYRRVGDPLDVVFIANDSSPWLNSFGIQVAGAYVPGLGATTGNLSGGTSDHRSFTRNGFAACFPFEDDAYYSPYIHSANDVIGTSANDFQLSEMITELVLAMTAELAVPASLTVDHTALGDTADVQGPYRVRATATSRVGSTITGLTLSGSGASGSFSVTMVPGVMPDEWIGDIPGQPAGTTVSYSLEAQDNQGRVARYPDGGAGELTFRVGSSSAFFQTDFESGQGGWTHGMIAQQDDWQLGTPQGNSSDPSGAYSGSNCWANDLGASGWNGAYQSNTHNWLRSPTIDCSGRFGVHLEFMRWLTVEDGYYDQARVLVNGTEVWMNPATPGGGTNHLIDTAWVPMDIDISHLADNNSAVQIEFRLQSDSSLVFGGWNIDDLALTEPQAPSLRSLISDRTFTGLAAGTPVNFAIDLQAANAGALYLILAGYTGSSPGFPFGGVTVPVNYDPLTELVLTYMWAAPVFTGFSGNLDPAGQAAATLALPAGSDPAMIGAELTFAGLTLLPGVAVTTPVQILLVQ